MFRRSLVPVWIGIILLSGMFLMGQDTWPPQPECTAPVDCNDTNPCTEDDCVDSICVFTNNTDPCDDSDSCTEGDTCSGGNCTGDPLDEDDDTFVSDACGGNDCDDTNADVHPGAPELCDGVDNQCPSDVGYGELDEPHDGMACIPAGCFDMGDHFAEGRANELPVHEVCISALEMDVHEVTNSEYAECVAGGGCTVPPNTTSGYPGEQRPTYYGDPTYDDYPVIYIDQHKATDYCTWAGKRLPTEAEWEYAARGGLSGKRYPLGDVITCDDANYGRGYNGSPCYNYGGLENDTTPVEYYAPNGYGLFDMAGNVREWVADWYDADYYSVSPLNDPPGPASGTYGLLRGGAWINYDPLTVSMRNYWSLHSYEAHDYGFRCARGGAFGP